MTDVLNAPIVDGGVVDNMIEFIEDILKERDKHKYNTIEWQNLNLEKAFILED